MFPFSHLKPSTLPTYLHRTNGTAAFALVTGATDGIGLGFAHELLAVGFNVLLHGRNPTKLAKVQSELQAAFPNARIHTLQADAVNFKLSDIMRLVGEIKAIKGMNLTVLVNNVGGTGVCKANFQTFEMHTPEEINGLINLNVVFTLQLTHALLPLLKEHGTKSLIMNIGSQAHLGLPFNPVYSGTKGFIHSFSHSMATEFAPFAYNEKIEVLEILVGSVQTQQNQIAKPTFFTPSGRTMAKAALDRVGCGERTGIAAYWPHALQQKLFAILPMPLTERLLVYALKGVVGKEERVW